MSTEISFVFYKDHDRYFVRDLRNGIYSEPIAECKTRAEAHQKAFDLQREVDESN